MKVVPIEILEALKKEVAIAVEAYEDRIVLLEKEIEQLKVDIKILREGGDI